jgi:hypothetical protein
MVSSETVAGGAGGTVGASNRYISEIEEASMADKQQPQPMKEPAKKHGDKINVDKGSDKERQTGGAGEPQTTPMELEKQGGIGGP